MKTGLGTLLSSLYFVCKGRLNLYFLFGHITNSSFFRYVSEYKEELSGRFQDTDLKNGNGQYETDELRVRRGNFSDQQIIVNIKVGNGQSGAEGMTEHKERSEIEKIFHPVSSFVLLRRLAVDWREVEKALQVLLSSTRGKQTLSNTERRSFSAWLYRNESEG